MASGNSSVPSIVSNGGRSAHQQRRPECMIQRGARNVTVCRAQARCDHAKSRGGRKMNDATRVEQRFEESTMFVNVSRQSGTPVSMGSAQRELSCDALSTGIQGRAGPREHPGPEQGAERAGASPIGSLLKMYLLCFPCCPTAWPTNT